MKISLYHIGKVTALAALAIALPFGESHAGGCGCGSIRAMISSAQTAINANTTAEATAIRSEIVMVGQNIIGTMDVNTSSIIRALIALKESNVAALKGLGAAGMAQETNDLYGAAAQPNALCGSSSVGAAVQVGAQASTIVRGDMRDKQIKHSNNPDMRPVDHLKRQLTDEHPDIKEMVDAVFPLDRTLTPEQFALAHETIKTLADPRPLPVPTVEQVEQSPAGQTYAVAHRVHQGRVHSATEALNQHVAFHAPTMPDEITSWATTQWQEAGAQGTPPGIVEGKLSESAFLNLLVQVRLGNPNWFTQIASATEAGLLRELVLMQAVQLQIAHKNLEYLDRISVVTAMDFLARMEGTDGKEMDALYENMIGAQQ